MANDEHVEPYGHDAVPAIPVIAELRLWVEGTKWSRTVRAIVDSGADLSLLPATLVSDVLSSAETTVIPVFGVGYDPQPRTAIRLSYSIGKFDSHEASFVLLGEEAIVGRDILNRYRATLDAPPLDGDQSRLILSKSA